MRLTGRYLNSPGLEVPKDTILIVPHTSNGFDGHYKDVISPLNGMAQRDWFDPHYYYCLPLTIGNQYGFLVKSMRNFDAIWDGTKSDAQITFIDNEGENLQNVKTGFSNGVITFQNMFAIKTEPGINLMTIQPPNMFVPGCVAMTGVIETDQIRRDFTFNLKITIPNVPIKVRVGDPIGAFIPIPRRFVDNFKLGLISDIFDRDIHENEIAESQALSLERTTVDTAKTHQSGRRYFNGVHTDGTKYTDHQKRLG